MPNANVQKHYNFAFVQTHILHKYTVYVTIQEGISGTKIEIHVVFCQSPSPHPPQMKDVWSFIPHLCIHSPHLCSSFVIYIHNVQFQILSWGMILPQKLTSNTFYSFPHGCGITSMKLALDPLPPLQPISFCIPHATFGMVPKQMYVHICFPHKIQHMIISVLSVNVTDHKFDVIPKIKCHSLCANKEIQTNKHPHTHTHLF